MIDIRHTPARADIKAKLPRVFTEAQRATNLLRNRWDSSKGTPVFTINGRYTSRGWTEWTQGFQYGNAIYLFDATGDTTMLDYGRRSTVESMANHVSHIGVHDHGFNNVSTYGNLLRLTAEGRIPHDDWQVEFYRLALKVSAAVQAARWTGIPGESGFIHSFNGPHSLFSDTVRTLRVLALGHQFGHVLMGEQDQRISLLARLLAHAETTARYNVYFGTGRDSYDIRGRVVHESIFNTKNGAYRCPSTQQGYTPFSTWTRGHAWVLSGFAEQLEWLYAWGRSEIGNPAGGGPATIGNPAGGEPTADGRLDAVAAEPRFLSVACAAADFYLEQTPTDGVPYWDTGAPGLARMGDYPNRPADPFNAFEPVDSSAGAISAQGLLRLGRYLTVHAARLAADALIRPAPEWPDAPTTAPAIRALGERYTAAGLVTADTLLSEPYLSTGASHEGILLHSVYHRPNGWDHAPDDTGVPRGESCMWGDYHLLELAVYLQRLTDATPAGGGLPGSAILPSGAADGGLPGSASGALPAESAPSIGDGRPIAAGSAPTGSARTAGSAPTGSAPPYLTFFGVDR